MQQKEKERRLSKREIASIESLSRRIGFLEDALIYSDRDVDLDYGNGTVATQLGCARSALETILQEYYD